MNRILAIETATDAISVAVADDDLVEERFQIAPRQHAKLVLPLVDELLQQVGWSLPDLRAIAFSQGPGSFTGLRIAAAVTQGLAYAAKLPVVPVPTLQTMAQQAWQEFGLEKVVVALDARMQELYVGSYQLTDGVMLPVSSDQLAKPEAVIWPEGDGWVTVGPGWQVYTEVLPSAVVSEINPKYCTLWPHAAAMLPWIGRQLARGETVTAEQALPVYLRSKSAWRKS